MQGRLLPRVGDRIQAFPAGEWETEFDLARRAGYDAIELIFDGPLNPLLSERGRTRINSASASSGLIVTSVSGDYFMHVPIFGPSADECEPILCDLIAACAEAGIPRINVPLEETSALNTAADVTAAAAALERPLAVAERHAIALAIECSLAPENLRAFVALVGHPSLGVNYDLGNSAAMGYCTDYALELLSDSLTGVHVKDRLRLFGATVPLGTGDADFPSHFAVLRRIRYAGPYIIQGARGDDHVGTAAKHLTYVRALLEHVYSGEAS